MAKIKSILIGARKLAFAAFLAGGLCFNACDNPITPIIPPEPPKPKPKISLIAELKDFVNIKYTATIKDLSNPVVSISKNSSSILTRAINDSVYSETLSYSGNKDITKGNYVFTLNGKTLDGRDTSIAATATIPNYAPEINIAGLQTGFDEGGETNVSLEGKLTDKNPEDNPVCIKDVVPIDGKTFVNVSADNLQIKNLENQTGIYKINVEIGNNENGISTTTIQGNIEDLLDVDGVLKDTKLNARQPGIVKIYDEAINPATGKNRKLGEIEVSTTGEFNKRLNYRVKDLTGHVLVQGRGIKNKTDTTSYVRTTKLPKGDVRGLELAVVSYDGLAENAISVDDFERHVYEVLENTEIMDDVTTRYTLWKWDFGEFGSKHPNKGVIINLFKDNNSSIPRDTSYAFFNNKTIENLKSRILDHEDIGSCFKGKINNSNQIIIVNNWNLDYNDGSLDGWAVVYPSREYNQTGTEMEGGYIKNSVTWVQVTKDGNLLWPVHIAHEAERIAGQKGFAKTLSYNNSIMHLSTLQNDPLHPQPLFADKKTAREIVYEDTYKHGQGKDADGLLRVYDVLGRRFLDE